MVEVRVARFRLSVHIHGILGPSKFKLKGIRILRMHGMK